MIRSLKAVDPPDASLIIPIAPGETPSWPERDGVRDIFSVLDLIIRLGAHEDIRNSISSVEAEYAAN